MTDRKEKHVRFKVEHTNEGPAITYQKPPVKKDGATTGSLRFPVLIASEHLNEPETALQDIADTLNDHWKVAD
ncbi:MAG: hypothetical protein ABJP02_05075 [Parasphingorhabdus sp.]|uniref:hypothetical protein n=1 Tax=Parasphingorhabdus sp. TaxID=2709688 RepID=UPI003298577B